MDSSKAVYDGLKCVGIDFIVSVPCVNLSKILGMIDEDDEIIHVPQNSGLGNSINALKSLTQLYEMPLLMIMSHRGTEGEGICGQVPMGESTPRILEAMDFKYFKPEKPEEAYENIKEAWDLSLQEGKPVSVLLEIKYW